MQRYRVRSAWSTFATSRWFRTTLAVLLLIPGTTTTSSVVEAGIKVAIRGEAYNKTVGQGRIWSCTCNIFQQLPWLSACRGAMRVLTKGKLISDADRPFVRQVTKWHTFFLLALPAKTRFPPFCFFCFLLACPLTFPLARRSVVLLPPFLT